MSTTKTNKKSPDTFLALVRQFPLRPIRTEREADAASETLIKLLKSKADKARDPGERDYIESLSVLIRDYENKTTIDALPTPDPLDILRHLMTEQGMTVGDLGKAIGSQPNASLILSGKRSMSKTNIIALARHFRLSPSVFLMS
ncbi:MAG TPA: helix-turn-helix domain-containing protein [Tepidisphaeraceae bacterium]|jgi:HTH-type transcriptional regulator/antitoxin HigA|nr:helix-turn-helix domain-containing protein [Tepidisphaeraceae bacterium]